MNFRVNILLRYPNLFPNLSSKSILHQDDRKLRKITTVAAVRSSEAQGVVQYMQVWIGNTSGKIDVSIEHTIQGDFKYIFPVSLHQRGRFSV